MSSLRIEIALAQRWRAVLGPHAEQTHRHPFDHQAEREEAGREGRRIEIVSVFRIAQFARRNETRSLGINCGP